MNDVAIVEAVRTPIGKFQGALSSVRPDDLAALVLRAVVRRAGIPAAAVEEVYLGCANQAGEDNRNVARMALLLAEYPYSVPAVTVNRLCASGLEAVVQGVRAIRVGDAAVVVAGGVESMSRAPYSVPRAPQHPKMGHVSMWDTSLGWRYPNPRLEERFPLDAMGETAENVAEKLGIDRESQDTFALASHRKACAAAEQGWFDAEIVEVPVADGVVRRDEGPRADASMTGLAKLKPAFRSGGTVTAGNSSTLNDGAAALVLMSSAEAERRGIRIRARVRAVGSAGVDPRFMGLGPVPATRVALQRAGLAVQEVHRWELNEAFAAQALGVVRELGIDPERVNAHGGSIALGHPLGCSGARILTTLLGVLERTGERIGVASLCVGVGQGLTMVIERPPSAGTPAPNRA
jgi:3-oxoadipyl-CoA thiolase